MGLAIFSTFFWGIFGPFLGFVLLVLGVIWFAIAMDLTTKNPKAMRTHARSAIGAWVASVLWTVVWVYMTVISILNWIAAAH